MGEDTRRGCRSAGYRVNFGGDILSEPTNPVTRPAHYIAPSGIELIDVIAHLPYCRSSAIKYIFRAGVKNPATLIEDLQKAQVMIAHEIARLSKG